MTNVYLFLATELFEKTSFGFGTVLLLAARCNTARQSVALGVTIRMWNVREKRSHPGSSPSCLVYFHAAWELHHLSYIISHAMLAIGMYFPPLHPLTGKMFVYGRRCAWDLMSLYSAPIHPRRKTRQTFGCPLPLELLFPLLMVTRIFSSV